MEAKVRQAPSHMPKNVEEPGVLQRIKLLLLCGFGVVACIAASLAYIALRDGETKLFHAAVSKI